MTSGCGCKRLKVGTRPPNGYPDPYGVPKDGTPCKRPPNGYGTAYWSLCMRCGSQSHHIKGKVVNVVHKEI